MIAPEVLAEWRRKPRKMVWDLFGVEPDHWQGEVLDAFPHNNRIAMKACKGPGKTCVVCWCMWNFMLTRPHAKIVATSITKENLDDNLWPELAKWQNRSELLKRAFEWNKTRIVARDHAETWFMSARTWPKHADKRAQADSLAGIHADYVLFVLDESGGIPEAVMASAEAALATGVETKLLQAGNPTHTEGPLWNACTVHRDKWVVVEITGDPDDPKRSPRIDKQWARDQIDLHGRENPWVLVNVFGRFPPSSLNTLIGPDEAEEAMRRHLREDQYDFMQKRLGFDPARFGDDANVMFPRQGRVARPFTEIRNARSEELAGRIAKEVQDWGAELVFVDSTGGHGAGVEDALLMAGVNVIPVAFNGKANDPSKYFNLRAEMWFRMTDALKRGGVVPRDSGLKKQLTTPMYWFEKGKLRVEEKAQIKARLGFSPDHADALACTYALPEERAGIPEVPGVPMKGGQAGRTEHDWDPMEEDDA